MRNMTRDDIKYCTRCGEQITCPEYVQLLKKSWHPDCVTCAVCSQTLDHKCFFRDNRFFCREDFLRTYSPKCSGCSGPINPADMVRTHGNKKFHLKCFVCFCCGKELRTAENVYVLEDGKYVCTADFLAGKAQMENSYMCPLSESDDMDGLEPGDVNMRSPLSDLATSIHQNPTTPLTPSTPKTPSTALPTTDLEKSSSISIKEEDNSDDDLDTDKVLDDDKKIDDDKSGNKRRGPRTTIKAKQLDVLKNAFNKTPKPTRHLREQLAKETNLPMRVIQVWFQNKRSKERRMKQLSSMSMRGHMFNNPRKLRELHGGMEDFGYFNGYPPFPGQQFPGYFAHGPQAMGYPPICPGMEQPLPPGGPMTNGEFTQIPMNNNIIQDQFPQHPVLPQQDDMTGSVGNGNFSDHPSSEIMAW